MAKIYLAAPFFSNGQHNRINQVKEALEANKTVSSIFRSSVQNKLKIMKSLLL